jgi:hypothetical protein
MTPNVETEPQDLNDRIKSFGDGRHESILVQFRLTWTEGARHAYSPDESGFGDCLPTGTRGFIPPHA